MIETWGGNSTFEYDGCVLSGTKIKYGTSNSVNVSTQQYSALRNYFLGQVIKVGTARTGAPGNSLGDWLQNNVTKTAIASYVAAILVREGYALRESDTEIRIIR
jgi:hypothetical protein